VKIFVDTNVFLDIVLKRDDYGASLAIFKAVKNRVYDGIVADISMVNIAYISRKVDVDIRAYLSAIEQSFSVQGADNAIIKDALVLANDDIEDNMQYYIALYAECDCIVSNDKGFYRGEIEVLGSDIFVDRYLK
jgi:predicted nucleic acid-binding protein